MILCAWTALLCFLALFSPPLPPLPPLLPPPRPLMTDFGMSPSSPRRAVANRRPAPHLLSLTAEGLPPEPKFPARLVARGWCASRSMGHMQAVNSVATPDRGNGMGHLEEYRAAVAGKHRGINASRMSE